MVAFDLKERIGGYRAVDNYTMRGDRMALTIRELLVVAMTFWFGIHFLPIGPLAAGNGILTDATSEFLGRWIWGIIGASVGGMQLLGIAATALGLHKPLYTPRMWLLSATVMWWCAIASIFLLNGSTLGAGMYLAMTLVSISVYRHVSLYNGRDGVWR